MRINQKYAALEWQKEYISFKIRQTMRIGQLLSILFLLSCSGQGERNTTVSSENIPIEQKTNDQQSETIEFLPNGLAQKMKGEWLTAILLDSIVQTREIFRWKDIFYGDLILSVKDADSVIIGGNTHWIELKYKVVDSKTIITPEWYGMKMIYSPEKDIVYRGDESSGDAYKRPPDKDFEKIIADEKLLMEYVINLLFKNDYLPTDFASKIKYISLGLETYNRFTFDAIGIENENGEINYYGWEYSGDTLNLYKTSSLYVDDSGFTSYNQEALDKQYFKN